ncbi:MAG: hypothetical protein ACLR1V_09845 [Coprococcus sp.]
MSEMKKVADGATGANILLEHDSADIAIRVTTNDARRNESHRRHADAHAGRKLDSPCQMMSISGHFLVSDRYDGNRQI